MAYDQGSLGALTVWWEEKLVYWTDLRKRTIKRAKMSGKMSGSGNCGQLNRDIAIDISELYTHIFRDIPRLCLFLFAR